jgi:hypothetical protein
MGMKAMKIDGKRIGLSLSIIQNKKQRNQDKNTKPKTMNMKCAKPKYKHIFIIMK